MPRAVLEWAACPLASASTDARFGVEQQHGAERSLALLVAGAHGRALAAALATRAPGLPLDVLEGMAPLPARAHTVVDARALDPGDDVPGALSRLKGSLFLLQPSRTLGVRRLVALTREDGSDAAAVAAGISGLIKTAALEWPELRCAVVDVAPDLDAAGVLLEELAAGLPDREVRRLPGPATSTRLVPRVVARPVGHGARRAHVTSSSVVVASGGARGVTATTLLALAREARPAVLLLGRTAVDAPEPACCQGLPDEGAIKRALLDDAKRRGEPVQLPRIGAAAQAVLAAREIRAFIGALQGEGARVLYRAVDVRDPAAVAAACDEARAAFGPITDLVHGAGVLADKKIEDKTPEQVDRVMDTKVLGLRALLAATREDPLRTVSLFSSVAGRFGNVGQVDYAMANEALNHLAVALATREHAGRGLVVKSLNWGPWEGGMVTPALKKLFAERGVAVLSHEDGARHFVDELTTLADPAVEVIIGGELAPEQRSRAATGHGSAAEATAGPTRMHLDGASWGILADHAIAGVPVLPVVGALELFSRARPDVRALADLHVRRGLRLPRLFEGGHDVEIREQDGTLTLVTPGEGAPHYTARVADAVDTAPLDRPRGVLPAAASALYQELLFHGPRFHLVEAVSACGEDGMIAQVRGVRAARWPGEWRTDAAAVDGALQAALLWARHLTGGAFLPTAIACVSLAQPGDGPLTCVLKARTAPTGPRAVVDAWLLDSDGAVRVTLTGVEIHRLPDDRAFARRPDAEAGSAR
ncbi:MAG: SDR family NAD(P)-dependent oxidoreductase [Deltaproteobacteria bacterium]|nr:SDR family NAD(P)-dependent oxidoreductase [Deltaproteobacteria bacterium]